MRTPERSAGTHRRVTLERTAQHAISPDGQSLAYLFDDADEGIMKIVPVDGGTAREVLRRPANRLDNVRFAVDGKSIYFTMRNSPGERGSVFRVSTTSGAAELVWKPRQPGGFTMVEPSVRRSDGAVDRATGRPHDAARRHDTRYAE